MTDTNDYQILDASFGYLFKFFRIESGFTTLVEFASFLKDAGFDYDPSLFSHWQRGNRRPSNEELIVSIVKVFVESKTILYKDQLLCFLSSIDKKQLFHKYCLKFGNLRAKKIPFNWIKQYNNFVYSEKTKGASKNKRPTSNAINFRFNFVIDADSYGYFNKIAREENMSKATFLRMLIRKHRDKGGEL